VQVFSGERVSLRNERATLTSLSEFLEKKLSGYSTTTEEDWQTLDKLERFLEELRKRAGADEGAQWRVYELRASTFRRICASRVLIEDKLIIEQTLATVRRWQESLLAEEEAKVS